MKVQLVRDALLTAIWQRRPKAGLIHHSDQGAPYASKAFRRLHKSYGLQGSMSRRGNSWDNGVVESFFASLKQEGIHWGCYQTRYDAQHDVLNHITMFYNQSRLHSYLDYISPNDFEIQLGNMQNVA